MATSHVKITTHGEIFTGQASRDIRKLLDDLKVEVAKSGEQVLKRELQGKIKEHNTGYGVGYVSQIHVKPLQKYNDQVITDGGVVYGAWLESGAYSPPRRFKGYRAWRRTRQKLRKWWVPVAQRRLDQLVARWNA